MVGRPAAGSLPISEGLIAQRDVALGHGRDVLSVGVPIEQVACAVGLLATAGGLGHHDIGGLHEWLATVVDDHAQSAIGAEFGDSTGVILIGAHEHGDGVAESRTATEDTSEHGTVTLLEPVTDGAAIPPSDPGFEECWLHGGLVL
jgi:hypothetical protein